MGPPLERADSRTGPAGGRLDRESLHPEQLERAPLIRRQTADGLLELRFQVRIALDRDLGQDIDERLARVAAQPPTLVIGRYPPRDREEPRLHAACRLVGVPGTRESPRELPL